MLADAYLQRVEAAGGEPHPAKLEKERTKLGRAPLVVLVCAVHVHDDKIPWSDQLGSAQAAAQNALLAATALGYGSMWRTGDPVFDPHVKRAVGLTEHDAIVGFLYLGTPHEGGEKPPNEPSLDGLVIEWQPGGGRIIGVIARPICTWPTWTQRGSLPTMGVAARQNSFDGLAAELRFVTVAGRPPAVLGGVRAAMAKAALQLQLEPAGPAELVTPAGRAARATGPTLRSARRRTRRYAERGLTATR